MRPPFAVRNAAGWVAAVIATPPWKRRRDRARYRRGFSGRHRPARGDGSPRLVGDEDGVAHGVAQAVEEAAAAGSMTPPLGDDAARVGAGVEEGTPVRRPRPAWGRARHGPRRHAEFELRPGAAVGAGNQQHRRTLNAPRRRRRPRRSGGLVVKRVEREGRVDRMRLAVATWWAKTLPDPGVALKPPVPQPQLTKSPGTGVLPMIGERSGVTSTMPPPVAQHPQPPHHGKTGRRSRPAYGWRCAARPSGYRRCRRPCPRR